tara:strand:+ start:81 stop:521 length:441 start_codon:yes stop_codon:yes gene_type:complete
MSNNLFYKSLATISTIGILILAGSSFISPKSESNQELDELLAKSKREIIQAKRDALKEVNSLRKEALSKINSSSNNTKGGSSESVWLVLRYGRWLNSVAGSTALEKIEMKDIEQCELMGAKWTASKLNPREAPKFTVLTFECLEGK